MFGELNESDVKLIVSIIAALVSLFGAFLSYIMAKRRMYLDVIVRKRQKSVEERRQALKELYYYTDPVLLTHKMIEPEEHIRKLTEIHACFVYRLLETLYPESELIKCIDDVIKETIDYIHGESCEPPSSIKRNECLQRIKLYNFASWLFVQSQSKGIKKDSVSAFNKCYRECLEQLLETDENTGTEQSVRKRKSYVPVYELERELFSVKSEIEMMDNLSLSD